MAMSHQIGLKFINFLQEIGFSRRRAHLKRRPDLDPSLVDALRQRVEQIFTEYRDDHILNADETFWRCTEQSNYTWAPTGSDNIHIYVPNNEKDGFTALVKKIIKVIHYH